MTNEDAKKSLSVSANDVIQLDPESELGKAYGPQFVIVEEVRSWGVAGYFIYVEEKGKFGSAPLRVPNDTFQVIGKAVWGSIGEG